LFVAPQIALAVACALYAIFFLNSTPVAAIWWRDKKYQKIFLEYQKEFPGQEDLVVVAEERTTRKRTGSSWSGLPRSWRRRQICSHAGFSQGDLRCSGGKALLFVRDADWKNAPDARRIPTVHRTVHAHDESGVVFNA